MHIPRNSLRFVLVILAFIFSLVYFSTRLLLIQVFKSSYLERLAETQHNHSIHLEPKRGTIYDRNLRPLALNLPAYSLYAQPRTMREKDKKEALRQLPNIIDMDFRTLSDRLGKNKYFVWLERKISLKEVNEIKALGIKGLGFIDESKRHYPNAELAAHIIGFVGVDNNGLEGLEAKYDSYLKGEYGWAQVLQDAHQRKLMIEKDFMPAKDGFDIVLTIDETIQYVAESALEKAFQKYNAKGATIIVMNPKTGEILALANRPTFNLLKSFTSTVDARRNRALCDMYEPGSVFKIVTVTAALEEDKFTETDKFFCENGAYRIGNHVLHDHQKHGTLTFSQVFEQSSNIGVTKIAQALGPSIIYKYARLFRFGISTEIGLPGEVAGILKPVSAWSKTSIGAIPIGQEVTVTAMQLASAISAIANDGIYMKPFVVNYIKDQKGEIIKEFKPQEISRVMNKTTADRVKTILAGAVQNGTGKMAQIKDVSVGGKTGTAQKVVGNTYSHDKFYATFIGFAPVEDPQLAMVIVFDEPYPSHFGGTVAAPVFKEVAESTLKYLASQNPSSLKELAQNTPAVQNR